MLERPDLDSYSERAIAGLVLGMVAAAAIFFGGVRGSEFAVVAGMAGAALLLWLARFWLNPSHRFLLHPVIWPVLGFVGYAAWRAANADVPYVARQELLLIAVVVLAFLIALHNLHGQDTTQWIVHILAGLGCLLAAYAIIQFLGESRKVLWLDQPAGYLKRAGGTFVNPNHLAAFLGLLLPLSLAQLLVGRGKAVVKVLHGYCALVMLGGVAVTMSRGGWAAVAAGVGGLMIWIGFRRRELRLPILVLAVLFAVGGWLFLRQSEKARARVANVTRTDNPDAGFGRPWLWKPALKMWQDHRWLGVGPAHYDVRFPEYRSWQIQANPGWAHNEYVNLLADYGLTGALLAAAAGGAFLWGVIRSVKYVERGGGDLCTRGSNRTAFFVGAITGLGTLAIHCVVDFNLHIPAVVLAAAVVAGLLASNLRFATERFWVTPRLAGQIAITVLGVGTLVWLLPLASRMGREGVALNRVAQATAITPTLLSDLERAAALAPDNPRTAFELGENLRRLSFAGDADWRARGEEALKWLERAAALNPFDAHTRLRLAQTVNWLGDRDRAEREFTEALRKGPNDVVIANSVAWFLLNNGRAAEARDLLLKSIEWKPWANWSAHDYLEKAERQLKQP
jgi:O-antigen ligase